MDLSIVIINYKTQSVTANCLRTIKKSQDKLKKEVILVDNGSNDGSVEHFKQHFPWVKVCVSSINLGFSGGNNLGIKQAIGKYIWLLNSDTLLKKDTISTLMKHVVKNDSLIASCRLLNKNNTIQPQGGFLPDLWRLACWMLFIDDLPIINQLIKPYHQNLKRFFLTDQHPGWLAGTALLIKRALYDQMHGLDKHIFMYGEDVEFCLRAKNKGIRLDYFHQPKIIHLGQASGSSRGAILGEFKGLKYIYQKHQPVWQYFCLRLLLKIGALLRLIIFRDPIYAKAFKLA